ncbi:MAG: dienelactone hydrolase family protein [Candidatus Pristimantibacillus sp.]
MLTINNGSDTLIIVIHEIYGVNRYMQKLCESLSDQGFDLICPNLLEQATAFDYTQEEMAYRHFMEEVGFSNASAKIQHLLLEVRSKYRKVFLAGFSVGATIAWILSEDKLIDGVVGYYGSRIRNYVELSPTCPVLLLFAREEPSFNVDELLLTLTNPTTKTLIFNGKHGFSDPYSPNYNQQSAQEAFKEMTHFFHSSNA